MSSGRPRSFSFPPTVSACRCFCLKLRQRDPLTCACQQRRLRRRTVLLQGTSAGAARLCNVRHRQPAPCMTPAPTRLLLAWPAHRRRTGRRSTGSRAAAISPTTTREWLGCASLHPGQAPGWPVPLLCLLRLLSVSPAASRRQVGLAHSPPPPPLAAAAPSTPDSLLRATPPARARSLLLGPAC